MSELTTQESSDDLDPISESPSKTLDDDEDRGPSSSENDETLEDDDNIQQVQANTEEDKTKSDLDTANANLDFGSKTADIENNIPVSSLTI